MMHGGYFNSKAYMTDDLMDTLIISCKTLEDELELAMKNTGTEYPVEYIDSGLHERPKKLAEAVTEHFENVSAKRVIMPLGQCGNSLIGIRTGAFELIMPKVDDCLSLLIGSTEEKARIGAEDHAFFMTEGWLRGESTIMSQYARSVEKYGEDTALAIMEMMYEHYTTIGLIDAEAAPIDRLYEETAHMAELLGLTRKIYPGTVKYIEDLLTGPWDSERFIVKGPFETITADDYR